jgi:hypothetical protein
MVCPRHFVSAVAAQGRVASVMGVCGTLAPLGAAPLGSGGKEAAERSGCPVTLHGELTTSCRLCGLTAVADANLTVVSCGTQHMLPLCQWSLIPLVSERHMRCDTCGRASLSVPEGADSSKLGVWPGVCAWCGMRASPTVASAMS